MNQVKHPLTLFIHFPDTRVIFHSRCKHQNKLHHVLILTSSVYSAGTWLLFRRPLPGPRPSAWDTPPGSGWWSHRHPAGHTTADILLLLLGWCSPPENHRNWNKSEITSRSRRNDTYRDLHSRRRRRRGRRGRREGGRKRGVFPTWWRK